MSHGIGFSSGIDGTVAVFATVSDFVLIRLAEAGESAAADAVARGYKYAGYIAITIGEATVAIEPGFEATMVRAGLRFAEELGPRLKARQLACMEDSK